MSNSKEKKKNNTICKDDFISFLADSTPQEINEMIKKKGKPPRMICPMFFFPEKDE